MYQFKPAMNDNSLGLKQYYGIKRKMIGLKFFIFMKSMTPFIFGQIHK